MRMRSSAFYLVIIILCCAVSCSPQPTELLSTAKALSAAESIAAEPSPANLVNLEVPSFEAEFLPLVERLLKAPFAPDRLDPDTDYPICLMPISERLYKLQLLLYPDTLPCASSKQGDLYLLYSYERGDTLAWQGVVTATQEVVAITKLIVREGDEYFLVYTKQGVGGSGSVSYQQMVREAVTVPRLPGVDQADVESLIENIVGYACGLNWDKRLGFDQQVTALNWALTSEYWADQRSAAQALGEIGPQAAASIPSLLQLLEDDGLLTRVVAETLGKMEEEAAAAVPMIVRSLDKSVDASVRYSLVDAIGNIGPQAAYAVPALIEIINDESEYREVRLVAVRSLGKIGSDHDIVAALCSVLVESDDEDVRSATAYVLGHIGSGRDIAHIMIQAMQNDSSNSTQMAIVEALGDLGPEEGVVTALVQSLQDLSLRGTAVEALGKIGPGADAAVPALIQALEHEDAIFVQTALVRTLGKIGPGATEAVPILIGVLRDGTDELLFWTPFALEQITGQDFGEDSDAWQGWYSQQK